MKNMQGLEGGSIYGHAGKGIRRLGGVHQVGATYNGRVWLEGEGEGRVWERRLWKLKERNES